MYLSGESHDISYIADFGRYTTGSLSHEDVGGRFQPSHVRDSGGSVLFHTSNWLSSAAVSRFRWVMSKAYVRIVGPNTKYFFS